MSLNSSVNSSSPSADKHEAFYWCSKQLAGPVIWSVFSVVCFLLGFPASLTVLYVLLQKKRQTVFSDVFTLSVAVIDLTLTGTAPFTVCNYMVWNSFAFEWICNFILSFTMTGRPLFMACICGDCYFAVVHPIAYKTSKKVIIVKKAISATVWIIVLGVCSTFASLAWLISSPWSSTFILIALLIISFCTISILRALRNPDPSGNSNIHPQKKKALQAIRISCIMTFIAYVPPAIILLFGRLMSVDETEWLCGLLFYGCCFSMFGCVLMPILYLVNVEKLNITKKWWKK